VSAGDIYYGQIRRLREFTITDDHLKLLERMYVGWDEMEYGAPAIDGKRPYGNSDVEADIAEILGWPEPDEDGEMPDGQRERAERIHAEMGLVLQIGLSTGSFHEGRYVNKSQYGIDWHREDDHA
jgi:hypothetical protein